MQVASEEQKNNRPLELRSGSSCLNPPVLGFPIGFRVPSRAVQLSTLL